MPTPSVSARDWTYPFDKGQHYSKSCLSWAHDQQGSELFKLSFTALRVSQPCFYFSTGLQILFQLKLNEERTHIVYFSLRRNPNFNIPLGTVSSTMQSLMNLCLVRFQPTGLSFLTSSFWQLRALSHEPQKEISDENILRKYTLPIATDVPFIYLVYVCKGNKN